MGRRRVRELGLWEGEGCGSFIYGKEKGEKLYLRKEEG